MQKLKPIAVSDLLNKYALDHNSIIFRCKQLKKLNEFLGELLPEPLVKNCGIASFYDGNLTLYTRSPAWCYKLRIHARHISKFMNKKGISIKKVLIIVVSDNTNYATKSLPKARLKNSHKRIIINAMASMKSSELKSVLQEFIDGFDKLTDNTKKTPAD